MRNVSRNKFTDLHILTPAQVLVIGFAVIILVGALLLTLPQASQDGQRLAFIDALFTATSATCVTGLVVVDTGSHFTLLGQLIILVLIQIGGLGFMAMSILIAMVMGQKIGLRSRMLAQEAFNQMNLAGVVNLTRRIVLITIFIEVIGAIILSARWSLDFPLGTAIYYGIFHSISAFCNAGFDLMGDFGSLTIYQGDWVVNLTIISLFILGGLGFVVLSELYNYPKYKYLSLHSKMVLRVTAILSLVGLVLIFALEYFNTRTLYSLSFTNKLLVSFFQSVTTRTAGYNTLIIGDMTDASLFIMIILMFIGASPGSTGGGIKTTTFGAMLLAVRSTINGQEDVEFSGKRISREIVRRAFAITVIALFLITIVTTILSVTESENIVGRDFIRVLFEVVSAFGTVGLSTGITPDLTPIGKILLSMVMFMGRLGPLTIAVALAYRRKKSIFRYPEDRIIVG